MNSQQLRDEVANNSRIIATLREALAVKDECITELRSINLLQQQTIENQRAQLEVAHNTLMELGIEPDSSSFSSRSSVQASEQFGGLTAGDIDDAIYANGLERQAACEAPQEDAPEGEPVINPVVQHLVRQALAAA